MVYVWAILLFNVFGQQQAVLTDDAGKMLQFANYNACQNALVQRGYANINIMGIHGRCKQVGVPVAK